MRGVFVGAIVLGLVVGVSVAGMRAFNGGSPAALDAEDGRPDVSPQELAGRWASAWTAEAYGALYELTSAATQHRLPRAEFAEAYKSFGAEVTATTVTAVVTVADPERAILAVHVSTAYFGELEYTIALTFTGAGGHLAVEWEPAAVHPAMVAGNRFASEIQRPTRGAILDREGTALAVTRDVRTMGLNRSAVGDRPALTGALVQLGFTPEQVAAAFESGLGQTQRVALGPIRDDQAEAAAALVRIPGVLVYFETQRVHPLGPSAAHAVGYTRELTAEELEQRSGEGVRLGDRVGATGLERSLEALLAGQAGAELRVVGPAGATVETVMSRSYIPGRDVTTTLDARVLQVAAARLGTRAGAAVVIDPVTNAILALNSSPTFDPDAFERNDAAALAAITAAPNSPQANRATRGLYSAGSTFKLVTGAAGLASGLYRVTDRIQCGSTWFGLDPPRKNWEGAQGPLTIAEGLMRSCNPVFYEIALGLYNETDGELSQMARAFGYGTATGTVGLADEAGLVPDAQWKRTTRNEAWFPGDEVNLGIGQGDLLITPLQLANAYSSFLAGELRTPVILSTERVVSRGTIPLTAEQFALLRLGLKLVTGPGGTAAAAFAKAGYTDFGGKSGTAEDVGTQQHVLFVAYSPEAAPRAVAAVVLDEGVSGSVEAGPIARDLVLAAQ